MTSGSRPGGVTGVRDTLRGYRAIDVVSLLEENWYGPLPLPFSRRISCTCRRLPVSACLCKPRNT